ncbi:uncharacterized protein LOC118820458 isoform X2 [Colossoma macropomum]|uniref:uncharacterized protein LOC118820458 isoform X2 n=1 Tax=Colossoma macropomum TaxID=42526 RepID=UPI001863DA50|nr:uncharacterized protein LOC118820458 isoform X2 [Colossoma macropomum]
MVCWTVEKEILLIDFMQARRVLWDPKDENYYRRGDRDAVLDELAELLGHDERGNKYSHAVYVPRWVHFNRMLFLRDVLRTRPVQDNMKHSTILKTCLKDECEEELEDGAIPSTSDSCTTPEAPAPRQRKRKANIDESDATRMDICNSILKCLQQPSEVDPNDTFGKYVADTLKGMSLWNRELCKAEIQQVMSKHLLNDMQNDA